MYDYIWLCMIVNAYVWLCITMCMSMYEYVWLCMTMNDYVQLCVTMYDYLWLYMTMFDWVREREREKKLKRNYPFANFFTLSKFLKQFKLFYMIQIFSKCPYTFKQPLTLFTFVYFCLPLHTFVHLCLPLFTFVYLCPPLLPSSVPVGQFQLSPIWTEICIIITVTPTQTSICGPLLD